MGSRAFLASFAALAGIVSAACSKPGGGSPPPVREPYPGGVVEIGGSPGQVQLTGVALRSGGGQTSPVTISIPAIPWAGLTASVVPMLSFEGVESWTLTFQPIGA